MLAQFSKEEIVAWGRRFIKNYGQVFSDGLQFFVGLVRSQVAYMAVNMSRNPDDKDHYSGL
ncbi:MAG: hypothetical protein VXY77_01380 [Pseudomonadota bacterium]|nr:hypothetical protein [Pseudomonadota bacterium]